ARLLDVGQLDDLFDPALWQRHRRGLSNATARGTACGDIVFLLASTAYVTALTLTTVANVAALGALSPIFTALLSRAVTGKSVNATVWLAALLALVGIAVIMNGGLVGGHCIGNLLALSVAL